MSLESILERIAVALEKIAGQAPAAAAPVATVKTKAEKPKVEDSTAKVEPTEPKQPEAEEVEAVVAELLGKGKKAEIVALNKKYGTEKWRPLLGTEKMPAYFKELQALNAAT